LERHQYRHRDQYQQADEVRARPVQRKHQRGRREQPELEI
jgi:hypothetical protein